MECALLPHLNEVDPLRQGLYQSFSFHICRYFWKLSEWCATTSCSAVFAVNFCSCGFVRSPFASIITMTLESSFLSFHSETHNSKSSMNCFLGWGLDILSFSRALYCCINAVGYSASLENFLANFIS